MGSMKLIIAGGRDYRLTKDDLAKLDAIEGVTEVVSGGCRGVDSDRELWARSKGLAIRRFPADWKAHGRQAGPRRNSEMAQYADAVALFTGGKGTASMECEARRWLVEIYDFRTQPTGGIG